MNYNAPVEQESLRSQKSATQPTASATPHRAVAPGWLRVTVSILVIIGCLFVSAGMFGFLAGFKTAPPQEPPAVNALRVDAFVVEQSDLQEFVSGFGTARADREVVVSAEVAGRITEANALKVGNAVSGRDVAINPQGKSVRHDGDVIVEIDPLTYEERVQQANALVEQDQIAIERLAQEHATHLRLLEQQNRRLKTIEAELVRTEDLLAQGAGRETDVQRTRLEVEQYREAHIRLENEVELYPIRLKELQTRKAAHQNDLKLAQFELEKTTVYAPFSGFLSDIYVEEGQYVRPGDRLVQITNLDKVEVPIPLPTRRAAAIERLLAHGHSPQVQLALREEDFVTSGENCWTGIIRRIDPVADEQTRTVMVFVEVDNHEQPSPLKPGTFTYARVEAGVIPSTAGCLIPRDAIVNGMVYTVDERNDTASSATEGRVHARPQPITVSQVIQTFALVHGVDAGDRIVVTNLDIVRDGTPLNIQRTRTLDGEFERLKVPYLTRR